MEQEQRGAEQEHREAEGKNGSTVEGEIGELGSNGEADGSRCAERTWRRATDDTLGNVTYYGKEMGGNERLGSGKKMPGSNERDESGCFQ